MGKALEGTAPSPSTGRHVATRSRRGISSSSPPTADGFGTGTLVPSPQSQSFSQTYGSILPTSLAYIVPLTRGCSPWRPDAVMSTTGCGRHSVLRIFKGRWERTGHHATCGALPATGPYLRLSRFQALDGIHRPIWAAFPNNPTRRQRLVVRQGPGTTGLSPSPAPPSRGLGPGPPLRTLLQTTIRTTEPPNSKAGLFPIRSPLLRESFAKGSWSLDARWAVAATAKRAELQPPLVATSVDVDSHLGQSRARGAREASICPAMTARPVIEARCEGTTRCVAPRQTCPRPNGFGRNLRSKTRWFTGFCNSHQVSHFAMVFIDARAEISVVESRFHLQKKHRSPRRTPRTGREGQAIDSSIPWHFPRRGSLVARRARWGTRAGDGGGARAECRSTPPVRTPQLLNMFAGSFCCAGFHNDPSAGSPTETLLRLLLPLNDKVQWTSRDVAGNEPPTSTRSEHFILSFNR
ncbi:hypothetical protein CQW23_35354 [Capsicum baccatum]|uniref:Protein TAR1 n=1 Tax=Capsicum baccatum TaxID=33114 RepID=A0A2G2UWA3_CAPBA|nr:hypothetical protein CQW23_35354 [Capsicum baccatum]